MNKDIDKAINQNKTAIAEIEGISERYHKAGLHLHNTARVLAGKETIQEVKPMGKLAKAFIAPCHADICFLEAIKRNVNNAIRVIARLEKTERKPPIMETIEKFNEQIAQAQKDAPERERLRPAIHDGR